MNEMHEINVPFELKHEAINSGLIFNVEEHKWYGNEETVRIFAETALHTSTKTTKSASSTSTILNENNENNESKYNIWTKLLENKDVLDIAKALHDGNIPSTEDELTLMFKILNTYDENQYPVTYKALCYFSPSFRSRFGEAYIASLIEDKVFTTDYRNEIKNLPIKESDKQLLLFVFPL